MASARISTFSSETSSSTSSSLLKDAGVSTSSLEQSGIATIATGSRNDTDTVCESIATAASSSQPLDNAPSDAPSITLDALPATGHPEPTTFRNETSASYRSASASDTTDSVTEKSALSSVAAQYASSPDGHGVTDATVFPVVLHTVTHYYDLSVWRWNLVIDLAV
jgi:hypothetical protein